MQSRQTDPEWWQMQSNYEEMSKLATEAGVVLGVSGANIDELHDTVEAIEKLGNKKPCS